MEELIRILLKWLKPIAVVCVIAAVGSAGISLLLPNYYMSQTVFLPSNPHYMEPNNLYATESGGQPVYLFGGPTDMYRILALSESRELQDYVIEKYDLYDYWEIEKDAKFAEFKIRERFAKYIKTYQTPNGMMQSEVSDTDPQLAATICNDILGRLDKMNKRVVTEKMQDKLAYFEQDQIRLKDKVQMFKDSLVQIIETTPDDTLTQNLLEKLMNTATGQYNLSNMIFEQQSKALTQEYSTIYIIEPAVPATRKTSPKRSLIVLSAVLISLLVMVFVAVFLEKFRELKFNKE
ncbi:MAG: hypothetical protein ACPGVB_11930 [Chitinophagales bacterium]